MAASAIPSLSRVPLRLTSRWLSHTVTSHAPKLIPHNRYQLSFDFTCDLPILPVTLLLHAGTTQYSRPRRSSASLTYACQLSIFPNTWEPSDPLVYLNCDGLQAVVSDPRLKEDPRPYVSALAPADAPDPLTLSTGSLLPLATVATSPDVSLIVLLILKSDTRANRGRWSLKPDVPLPPSLAFLLHGRQSGSFPSHP